MQQDPISDPPTHLSWDGASTIMCVFPAPGGEGSVLRSYHYSAQGAVTLEASSTPLPQVPVGIRVYRLSWCPPELGTMLAGTCSDGGVRVWIKRGGRWGDLVTLWGGAGEGCASPGEEGDVDFAPRHFGLGLAAGGEDGCVRVHYALNASSLRAWELKEEFSLGPSSSITALSWCPSHGDVPMMVVASHGRQGGNGSNSISSSSSSSGNGIRSNAPPPPRLTLWGWANSLAAAVSAPTAASAAALSGMGGGGKWTPMLEFLGASANEVRSVAWAPSPGRAYHTIASGGADGRLCLWRVAAAAGGASGGRGVGGSAQRPTPVEEATLLSAYSSSRGGLLEGGGEFKEVGVKVLPHGDMVWGSPVAVIPRAQGVVGVGGRGVPVVQVAWNSSGSTLVSGSMQVIKLWRENLGGLWECVEEIERGE